MLLACRSRIGLKRSASAGDPPGSFLARMAEASAARFNRFSRGRIVGKAEAGAPRDHIRRRVLKKDGAPASLRAIDAVLAKARADPEWEGLDSGASLETV